jgi:hypothetical protein
MVDVKRIGRKVSSVQYGLKPMLEEVAKTEAKSCVPESLRAARELYASKEHQAA